MLRVVNIFQMFLFAFVAVSSESLQLIETSVLNETTSDGSRPTFLWENFKL